MKRQRTRLKKDGAIMSPPSSGHSSQTILETSERQRQDEKAENLSTISTRIRRRSCFTFASGSGPIAHPSRQHRVEVIRMLNAIKTLLSSMASTHLNLSEWGAVTALMTFLVLWFGSAFA